MLTTAQEKTFLNCSQYAFVGASSNTAKFGNKLFEDYKKAGAKVIPVNPNEISIDGIQCLKSVEELPSPSTTGVLIVTQPSVTLSVLKSVLSMGTIPIVFVQLGAANQAVADFVNANNLSDKVLIEDNFGTGAEKKRTSDLSPIDTKVNTVPPVNINLRKSAVVINRRTVSTPFASKGTPTTPSRATPNVLVAIPSAPTTAIGTPTAPLVSSPIIRTPIKMSPTPTTNNANPIQQRSSSAPSLPAFTGASVPSTPTSSILKPKVDIIPCAGIAMLRKITASMAATAGNLTNALTSPVADSPSVLHQLTQGMTSGMKALAVRTA